MAQNSDMTGAIERLNKCLTFNKKNTAARNLLGLVYYGIGRIGDACGQWRLSVSLLPEGNPASGYLELLGKNPRQLTRLNDAVGMYNTALDYVRQKSDDMAIIQLKKAVDIIPCFIDALNLLSFSYLIQGENNKAAGIIEKTLTADVNNPLALHYYKQIYADRPRPAPARPAAKSVAAAVPIRPIKEAAAAPPVKLKPSDDTGFGRSFPIIGVISFILGALSAFAILYILIMPERIAEKDKEIGTLQSDYTAQVQSLQSQLSDAQAENAQLTSTNKEWEQKYSDLQDQLTLTIKTYQIESAEQLMNNGLYQEAVDAANVIDVSNMPSDLQDRLQNIITASYPQLVQKYYDDGVSFYNKGQYDDSKQQFDNALLFVLPGDDLGDDVLYYLGRIAVRQNDTDAAKDYFQRILDEYPDGNQVANATSRLKSLG